MAGDTPEEEKRKKAVFDAMSARSRKRVCDKGYDKWDPFLIPKDPIDIRTDQRGETALSLMRRFLQTRPPEGYSNAYDQGAWELCMGMTSDDDRWKGMYDFSCWYNDLCKNGDL